MRGLDLTKSDERVRWAYLREEFSDVFKRMFSEFHTLYNEPGFIKEIQIRRLQWVSDGFE